MLADLEWYALLPQGGRSCVGMKLAYAEAKIALIRLYQRYTLRLTPGQVLGPVATLITKPLREENAAVYWERKSVLVCNIFITRSLGSEATHVALSSVADRLI